MTVTESVLYEGLAERVQQQIQQGLFQPGERLPSVRKLAERESVSVSTVLAAYERLERLRLIEARPKSGYFVLHQAREQLSEPSICSPPARPVPAHISPLMMDLIDTRKRGRLNFSTAMPAQDTNIGRTLRRTFARLSREGKFLHNGGYGALDGAEPLRRQIALRSLDAGLTVSADDIIVTVGCQNAISLALRVATRPGDVVAVESPCYLGFLQMIEAYGLKAIEIPSHPSDGLSLEALQLALEQWPIRTLISVPSFSNPLGSCMPTAKRRALVDLLGKYDLTMIEDDIYGEMSFFTGQRPTAVKAFDRDGRVMLCSSLSKSIDPQLRVGWIMPGRHYNEVLHQKYITTLSLPELPQLAAAELMAGGQYDRHLRHCRELYCSRLAELTDLVAEHFPPETKAARPQGGIGLWLELPRHVDATRLYYRAREHDFAFSPGELFAVDNRYQHCLRIIFAQPWTDERKQAIAQLGAWVKEAIAVPPVSQRLPSEVS
ncbi:PLP-dependent aminotransferase family protein [Natronospirillum operosum]|uniref:PLP-dependent aminotransferase family protein n=1 Tax=Natronospirillum operosum TaxID=2759953 RepID=A0A4Z0WD38_9GAMM|nr:PLP-dependent aminotransferase family protein [Natronospirillum operosum]TGG91694.1 PLP-dependent aminotransferase family protein [Natronospirillum operosum]